MSDFIATEFADLQSSGRPPDLLADLYREIGISAVAAALYVMAMPVAPKNEATSNERRMPVPAILQSEDLVD
jgi:hypothetical protein